VEIVEDYAADLPSVVVDQSQLREVLLNIGLNALDAMPGGGSLRLSTSRSADRGSVRVTVEDTGAGIPQEHIPRLFDPFFTTKERGKGTGLGIAVSYGIVQAHAGSIEVESIAGKGSKFTIVLPLNASTAGSPASVSLAGGRVDGYGKGENPHSR
jgi:signal transduction histidine kinase